MPAAHQSPFYTGVPLRGPQTLAKSSHVEWGRIFCPEQPAPMAPAEPAPTPERKLMAAILEQAVAIIRGEAAAIPQAAQRAKALKETKGWFASEDRSWPCSFENICDVLGLDPSGIRRVVSETLAVGSRGTRRSRRTLPDCAPQRRARIVARAA